MLRDPGAGGDRAISGGADIQSGESIFFERDYLFRRQVRRTPPAIYSTSSLQHTRTGQTMRHMITVLSGARYSMGLRGVLSL